MKLPKINPEQIIKELSVLVLLAGAMWAGVNLVPQNTTVAMIVTLLLALQLVHNIYRK